MPLFAPQAPPAPSDQRSPRPPLSYAYGAERDPVPPIRRNEGPRGYSTRAGVWLRHAGYFAFIVVCSAATEGFTNHIPIAEHAGEWMFLSAAIMVLACVLGTAFWAPSRKELVEQLRHYLFGMVVGPGTGVAFVMWLTMGQFANNTNSTFAALMENALPIVYLCTVIIPALVYVKLVAGLRTIHRSRMDDQEMVNIWSRNADGLQR